MATVIELNGRRYNAQTGTPVDEPKSVDGFVARRAAVQASIMPSAGNAPSRHGNVKHARPHPQQHSTTLMRRSVTAPAVAFKRRANATGFAASPAISHGVAVAAKHSVGNIDDGRLARASQTTRSGLVQRFAPGSGFQPRQAAPTMAAPQAPPAAAPTPKVDVRLQPSGDVFERALAAATSHNEPYAAAPAHSKHGHRLRLAAGVASSLVAVALIVGFVAYQNLALIQLRIASSHAGIAATMPIWQPSGYRLGTLNYSHNNVALTYTNPASSQSFTISQSPTSWDAATLLSTYVNPNNDTYNSLVSGSMTIYTYGNNNATWVNNGIWYKLVSNGTLSNSQIVNLATSMRS